MKRILKILRPPVASVIAWLAVIYLTLTPQPLPPEVLPTFFGWDKLAHIAMFACLTATMVWDAHRLHPHGLRRRTVVVIVAATIAAGGAIELLQGTSLINRASDWGDFTANTLGCLLGGFLTNKILSERKIPSERKIQKNKRS